MFLQRLPQILHHSISLSPDLRSDLSTIDTPMKFFVDLAPERRFGSCIAIYGKRSYLAHPTVSFGCSTTRIVPYVLQKLVKLIEVRFIVGHLRLEYQGRHRSHACALGHVGGQGVRLFPLEVLSSVVLQLQQVLSPCFVFLPCLGHRPPYPVALLIILSFYHIFPLLTFQLLDIFSFRLYYTLPFITRALAPILAL
jgi:hypothetical protein